MTDVKQNGAFARGAQSFRKRLNPRLNTRGDKVVYLLVFFVTLSLSGKIADRLLAFHAPITGIGLVDFLLIFAGFLIAPAVVASVALTIFAIVRSRVGSGTVD